MNEEQKRLKEHYSGEKKWLKWGPYLSERQWGTVREDYSPDGTAWDYFPHDHARSRAYRWGEDGLAGICDEACHLCFALALWNGHDPILKERLFGLTGPEGNHGEDVKELYYYLDNTPTHSYMKHLYKYPHAAFPYEDLVQTNRQRSELEPEYELLDTPALATANYFDVFTEYAKATEEDLCIRITVINRGNQDAHITVLPTLWFRNLWSFGLSHTKPDIRLFESADRHCVVTEDVGIGSYYLHFQMPQRTLFTDNVTNTERLFGIDNESPFVKDAFHRAVVHDDYAWLAHLKNGSKFAPQYEYHLMPGESAEIRLRLTLDGQMQDVLGKNFEQVFKNRIAEANAFYRQFKKGDNEDLANIQRQAFAGMLWSKQYYNIDMPRWINGDPGQLSPPGKRRKGRNHHWMHLNNADIISMPDKWEYPWYAAWDLAFHCVPLAMLDAEFAKQQLVLFLREWYMHPNGQIPAYEWAFGDVNPPVHAWACLQVYKMDKERNGNDDKNFLRRVFQKLLINFTWWVNRKDVNDNNVFEGGFLGLDNIGVFDRSSYIPGGGRLEQADGTAWMAMYCLNMLEMALILGEDDIAYEDVATKFFEHFVYIAESLNRISANWTSAWDPHEGFFYDVLVLPDNRYIPLKIRSLVGLTTLFAVLVIERDKLKKLPNFHTRLKWFQNYRAQQNEYRDYLVVESPDEESDILLSLVPKDRLKHLLKALFDENEFLSKGGIRSLSKRHEVPYMVHIDGQEFGLRYEPGESTSGLFGGNSNWRGPVWIPMNYLIGHSLRVYGCFYQQHFQVEFPTGSGYWLTLDKAADAISKRLVCIFQRDILGERPVHGDANEYHHDPHYRDLLLFYEYFHGDNARGVGASHQTGWTGLVAELIDKSLW
ncbi:MAG TPA: glucosidase [Saprospiraceae bacterium]|nr:glucosidase [Saprospiraceae bacterium]HMP24011.1 glucosidase [Saprospiraceae bacterium]